MNVDSGLDIRDTQLDNMCVQYTNYLSGNKLLSFSRKSWFGVHNPEMHIQSHAHYGALFSGVYYMQYDPEYDYPTTFTSPIQNEIENWDGGRFEPNNEHTIPSTFPNYFNIKEGDVLLFPSWLSHYVPRSKEGAKKRITFVFNTFLQDETSIR
jgi:uncharacterized protein (TIGR02466 family)